MQASRNHPLAKRIILAIFTLGCIVILASTVSPTNSKAVAAATPTAITKQCVVSKPSTLPSKLRPLKATFSCPTKAKPRVCPKGTSCKPMPKIPPRLANSLVFIQIPEIVLPSTVFVTIPLLETGTVTLASSYTNWIARLTNVLNRNAVPNEGNCPDCFGTGQLKGIRIRPLGKPRGTMKYEWHTDYVARDATKPCPTCGGSGKAYDVNAHIIGVMIGHPENNVVYNCRATRLVINRRQTSPFGTDTCTFDASQSHGPIPVLRTKVTSGGNDPLRFQG